MPTHINCPNCHTPIDVDQVLSADAEQRIRQQYEKELQKNLATVNAEKKKLEEEQHRFEEKRRRENEIFQERLKAEKQKLETEMQAETQKRERELQQQLKQSIQADFENQLRVLQQGLADNEAR